MGEAHDGEEGQCACVRRLLGRLPCAPRSANSTLPSARLCLLLLSLILPTPPPPPPQLPEWKAVDYGTAAIIKGWERHMG